MALAPFSSPFAAILAKVVARVASALGVDVAFVTPVANDRYKVTVSETVFAYVQAFGVGSPRDPALSFENAGAGNLGRPVARRIRVYVYTRAGFDVFGSDSTALLGASTGQTVETPPTYPGAFAAGEVVFSSLSDYTPVASGRSLTLGPLHPLDTQGGPPERKAEDDAGLVREMLDFEAVYVLSVVKTEPNL